MIARLLNFWRCAQLRRAGVRLGPGARVGSGIDARTGGGVIELGPGSQLECGVVLHTYGGAIHCDENVFFGPYVVVYGHGGVEIGAHTLIASHCVLVAANHTVPPASELIRFQPDLPLPIRIGRDVWLGAGVKVLGGVTIGDGCVIGAGAVVTHDLPPHSIAHGVPARVVGSRAGRPSPSAGNP